ncbi:MAG: tetratricopeptide repeat protein [Limisphaerales bacterium]
MVELGYLDASALESSKGAAEAENLSQFNLAVALMDANQPSEAIKILQPLHERFPEMTAITMHLAVSLATAGNKSAARELGEKLLKNNPVPARAFALLGTLDLMDGNVESAIQRLAEAEKADASMPGLHVRIRAGVFAGKALGRCATLF